jgi:hypothetical protein
MRSDSRARSARHAWLACGVLLFVGCMAAPFKARAVYGPELEFRAYANRDAFDELIWNDAQQKQPVCPIVIHLPGGDLGDEQLRTTKALIDLGAKEEKYDIGEGKDKSRASVMTLDRGAMKLVVGYHNDRLASLTLRVTEPTRVTVRGKPVTLPLSRNDLIGTFGQPAQMIE